MLELSKSQRITGIDQIERPPSSPSNDKENLKNAAEPETSMTMKPMTTIAATSLFALSLIAAETLVAEPVTTRNLINPATSSKCPEGGVQLLDEQVYKFQPVEETPTKWVYEGGVLTASPKWDSVQTEESYQDFRMHVEFNVNDAPNADKPEANGNSGIYIQNRYELQILNSFHIPAEEYTASYCGSLYRLKMPDEIVCKKAGEWQSYDIVFRAARFEGEAKTEDARITVYHNGTLIHDDFAIPRKTGAGLKEGPEAQPIKLQGHANPVKFRNIWIEKLQLD